MMERTNFLCSLIGKPWVANDDEPEGYSCYRLWKTVQWELFEFHVPDVALPKEYNKFAAEKLILRELHNWTEIIPHPVVKQIVSPPDGATVLMSGNERLHHIGTWLKPESLILHVDRPDGVVAYPLSMMRQHWGKLVFILPKTESKANVAA